MGLRPPPSPLTPSNILFSNTHTLTSFPVVLCVAPRTFHRPTLNGLVVDVAEDDEAVEGRFVVEDEGDGAADDELWRVYALRDVDLPKRLEATANMVLDAGAISLSPLHLFTSERRTVDCSEGETKKQERRDGKDDERH